MFNYWIQDNIHGIVSPGLLSTSVIVIKVSPLESFRNTINTISIRLRVALFSYLDMKLKILSILSTLHEKNIKQADHYDARVIIAPIET